MPEPRRLGATTYPEQTAPGTPASANVVIYAKSDGRLYQKDDAGAESALAGGAGFVSHGSTAGTARPTGYDMVVWSGSVEPTNMLNNVDLWIDTDGTSVLYRVFASKTALDAGWTTPPEGAQAWATTEQSLYTWTGSGWVLPSSRTYNNKASLVAAWPNAPDGSVAFLSTPGEFWQKVAGTWQTTSPWFAKSANTLSAQASKSVTVTFPSMNGSAFTAAPEVSCTVEVGSNLDLVVNIQPSITATDFTYRVVTRDAVSVSGAYTIHWVAQGVRT